MPPRRLASTAAWTSTVAVADDQRHEAGHLVGRLRRRAGRLGVGRGGAVPVRLHQPRDDVGFDGARQVRQPLLGLVVARHQAGERRHAGARLRQAACPARHAHRSSTGRFTLHRCLLSPLVPKHRFAVHGAWQRCLTTAGADACDRSRPQVPIRSGCTPRGSQRQNTAHRCFHHCRRRRNVSIAAPRARRTAAGRTDAMIGAATKVSMPIYVNHD